MTPIKKKSKLAEIRVGIFVVASFIILALAVIYISSGSNIFGPTFEAVTHLPNVGGLKAGAPVQLAGVEVGSVQSVKILPPAEEPQNDQNLEVYRLTASALRELQARRERDETLKTEMSELVARRDRMTQAQAENTAEFNRLQNRITDLRLDIESNFNRITDVEEDLLRLRERIQNVEVILRIDENYRSWIRRDSEVGVGSIGLLGDTYIDISLGRSDEPAPQDGRGYIVIRGKKQADFRELITGIDDVIGNFGVLSQRFRNLTDNLEEGTVAQFIGNRSFYDNLDSTVREAGTTLKTTTDLVSEIKGGKGTMGRLISEDQLYQEFTSTVDSGKKLIDKISSSEGTMGKFINDSSVYDKTDSLLSSAKEIAERLNRGEGTLGKLTKDEALYERTKVALEKFATLVEEIEAGQGTMGRLVKDKTLYENLAQASAEIVKLLYDFRQDPKKYLTIRFRLF